MTIKRAYFVIFLLLLLISSISLVACSGAEEEANPTAEPAQAEPIQAEPTQAEPAQAEPVTITWWHIQTQDDEAQAWQELANQYMTQHPNVTIEITVFEDQAFQERVATVMQAGNPPDLFQSWGGGVLWEFAKAGLVRNITPQLEGEWKESFAAQSALEFYSLNGEYYGVPWSWGAVGLFYNKDLFAEAGLDPNMPPATWDEFLTALQRLKEAGITPISLGEQEKWTGNLWWAYLAIREGGEDAFLAASQRTASFADEPFVRAGQKLVELIALEPFPEGYLGLSYGDEASIFGNGKAGMELMGQWGPSFAAFQSESGKGVENLGWFPFPAVEGGAGNPQDVLGGGDGFAVGKNAPDEAVDFLRFLTSEDSQRYIVAVGMSPPTLKGLDDTLTDEYMKKIVQARDNAPYYQLYYDQFLPPAVGQSVNDAVQELFAGSATPQEAAQQIEEAAALELE